MQPAAFGRRALFVHDEQAQPKPQLSHDVRLFATAFLAGFVFVSVLLA